MDKKQVGASSSSSSSASSSVSFDHLFGPKEFSSSSSTTGIFNAIFPPPSTVMMRKQDFACQAGNHKYGTPDDITGSRKGESSSSIYQSGTVEPCNLSSSIYYGGQENYSSRTRATESNQFKKDRGEDDSNGSNSNSTSGGNWWKGSLYY